MLEKAELENTDTGAVFRCQFNPTEYEVTKTTSWVTRPTAQDDVPVAQFTGGESAKLTLRLFFDTSFDTGSVSTDLTTLMDLTKIAASTRNAETQRGRPPICIFRWGTVWQFRAVVEKLTLKYTLFRSDGTPTRATADATFLEVREVMPPQNPTSFSPEAGYRRRRVLPNETLAFIAYDEYGDAGKWRAIAEANGIEDPLRLTPGQALVIPAR